MWIWMWSLKHINSIGGTYQCYCLIAKSGWCHCHIWMSSIERVIVVSEKMWMLLGNIIVMSCSWKCHVWKMSLSCLKNDIDVSGKYHLSCMENTVVMSVKCTCHLQKISFFMLGKWECHDLKISLSWLINAMSFLENVNIVVC